jgi:hypothetical protein
VLALPLFVHAQDATPTSAPIEISGPVTATGTGTITISGLTVDVSGLVLTTPITPGTVITVTGVMSPTNVIIAQTIVINIVSATATPTSAVSATATNTLSVTSTATQAGTPAGTPSGTPAVTVTPTATPSGDVIIVIEGPVINIVTNIITIYDFDIEIDPHHPMLNLIQIGDVVRVEGAYGSTGVVVATVISNLSDMQLVAGATVSLEGPVESINGNIIVVNSISVQLAANDPLLQTVQVGQFVRVQGNFQNNNGVFVLVVVNVVIVNVNTGGGGGGGSNCVWQENGMSGMGKWKCKGSKKKS